MAAAGEHKEEAGHTCKYRISKEAMGAWYGANGIITTPSRRSMLVPEAFAKTGPEHWQVFYDTLDKHPDTAPIPAPPISNPMTTLFTNYTAPRHDGRTDPRRQRWMGCRRNSRNWSLARRTSCTRRAKDLPSRLNDPKSGLQQSLARCVEMHRARAGGRCCIRFYKEACCDSSSYKQAQAIRPDRLAAGRYVDRDGAPQGADGVPLCAAHDSGHHHLYGRPRAGFVWSQLLQVERVQAANLHWP